MTTFSERRENWERKFALILSEILCEEDDDGVKFVPNIAPALREFNNLLASVATSRVVLQRHARAAMEGEE